MSSGKEAGFSPTLPWPNGPATEGFDRWQSTQARTVISSRSGEDGVHDPASAAPEIGRAVDERTSELTVSCDPAPALLQQFEHAHPVFIAVHDVGTTSSRGVIAAVAEARGLEIKRLVIRRQGFGTTLAALEFIEFPGPSGARLRVYCTAAEADAHSREGLARVLLAFSRLGVLMVGNLTGKALTEALRPLRDDIVAGPWPNRDLLLVPLVASAALATQGTALGRSTGVSVRTTPTVARPIDAWPFISGTWDVLRTQVAGSDTAATDPSAARPASASPSAPAPAPAPAMPAPGQLPAVAPPLPLMTLQAMPPEPAPTRGLALQPVLLELLTDYVEQVCKLGGVIECCVFESASGRHVAYSGSEHDAESLASAGAILLAAAARAGRRLRVTSEPPDAAITLDTRHLILRAVPGHPEMMLHAVLDKDNTNLTLARLQIQRLDDLFAKPAA
jgi:hypothetical protein